MKRILIIPLLSTLFMAFPGDSRVPPPPPDLCLKQGNDEGCSLEIGQDSKTVSYSCPSSKQPPHTFHFQDQASILCVGLSPTTDGQTTLAALSEKGQFFIWSSQKDSQKPIPSIAQIVIKQPNRAQQIAFPPVGDSFVLVKAGEEWNAKDTSTVFLFNRNSSRFLEIPVLSSKRFSKHTFQIYWEDDHRFQIRRNASSEYPFNKEKDFLMCTGMDNHVSCQSFDQAQKSISKQR